MPNQRPRQGWIYKINPHRVVLRCKTKHEFIYDLPEPAEVECQHPDCQLKINSDRVLRGEHYYIIWSNNEFLDNHNYITTFTVVPLTSKETYKGLPTVYPIKNTSTNGLTRVSYALAHQLITIDANSFKKMGQDIWMERAGQLGADDKAAIERRLRYLLNLPEDPSDDWFLKNSDTNLLEKVFLYLPQEERESAIDSLIEKLGTEVNEQ